MRKKHTNRIPFLLIGLFAAVGILFSLTLLLSAPPGRQALEDYAIDRAYRPSDVVVYHSEAGGTDTYAGAVVLSACGVLSTGIETVGANPPRLNIDLRVLATAQGCSDKRMVEQSYQVSFASAGATSTLAAVIVNGEPQKFSVVER